MGQQCPSCRDDSNTVSAFEVTTCKEDEGDSSFFQCVKPEEVIKKEPSYRESSGSTDTSAALNQGNSEDGLRKVSDMSDPATSDEPSRSISVKGSHLIRFEEQAACIHQLCREARVLEAGEKLDELEQDVASTLKLVQSDASSELSQFREHIAMDVVLQKLRLMRPRIKAQLKPDGLLTIALKKQEGHNQWIVGTVRDPSISENFCLEIKVRWLEGSELVKNAGASQFMLCASVSGWPQPLEDFVALTRELDHGKKEFVHDCSEYNGTPGGPDQLMSTMLHYVIRPAMLPVIGFEFVNFREFALLEGTPIPGYPRGVLIVEESAPTGVPEFEGWQLPPTRRGYVQVAQTLLWHISADQGDPGCTQWTQVGRYTAPIPRWMLPLTLAHKICLRTIHMTFKKHRDAAFPGWDKAHGTRMKDPEVKDLYDAIDRKSVV